VTIASIVTNATNVRWHFAVDVRGLPFVFCSESTAVADITELQETGRQYLPVLAGVPEHGGDAIDYTQRRAIGGSLQVRLVEDASGTLASIIKPRQRRYTWLASDESTTSVLWAVGDNSAMSVPSWLYVDGETVRVVGKVFGDVAVARGCFGSVAQKHLGTSSQGADVYFDVWSAPPTWAGRRARLWVYATNASGALIAYESLGSFTLDGTPVYDGAGIWTLAASPLIDSYSRRKLGVACTEEHGAIWRHLDDGATSKLNFFPRRKNLWSFLTTSNTTYQRALLKNANGDAAIMRLAIDATDLTNGIVDCSGTEDGRIVRSHTRVESGQSPFDDLSAGVWWIDVKERITAKHFSLLTGNFSDVLLTALESRYGDSTNGTYDLLPGVDTDMTGAFDGQFGAGLSSSEIDETTFEEQLAVAPPGLSLVIDETFSVGDLLSDACTVIGLFWYADRAGLLQLKRLSEDESTSVLTLSESNVLGEPRVSYDDTGVIPHLKVLSNYDPVTGEYEGSLDLIDYNLTRRYPDKKDTVEVKSRLLCFDFAGGAQQLRPVAPKETVQFGLRRLQVQSGRGRVIVSLQASHEAYSLEIGDVVTLTLPDFPDLEGTTLTGKTGRVCGWRPDFAAGTVALQIEILDAVIRFAPSAEVASYDAGTGVITLASRDWSAGGLGFTAGSTVRLYDAASPATTGELLELSAVSAGTVTLLSAPVHTPAAGDWIEMAEQISTNTSGYGDEDWAYQIDTTIFAQKRWR